MGLLTPKTETPKKPTTVQPETIKFDYKRAAESSDDISYKNLLTHIAGSSWSVDYYSQQISDDSELRPLDVGVDPVYQQYIKINDYEFKVTSSLSSTQNQETNEFEVTGEATTYPSLIPNVGDMFTAGVGDGRRAIFTITDAERLTIMKETCYNISYTLVSFTDDPRFEDLELKVVKTTHFIKKLLQHEQDPIVVGDDYNNYLLLTQSTDRLITLYFEQFYDKGNSTLLLPDQSERTYDTFLVGFIRKFMDTKTHPYLSKLSVFKTTLIGDNVPLTLWDILLRHYESLIPIACKKMSLTRTTAFKTGPFTDSVYYTDIQKVYYPSEGQGFSTVVKSTPLDLDEGIKYFLDNNIVNQETPISQDYVLMESDRHWIKPVMIDDNYVFSQAFYDGDRQNMSILESMSTDALEGIPLDQKQLYKMVKTCNEWSKLDQFYYIPILLLLTKMAVHGL